jgi:hypothetical protein
VAEQRLAGKGACACWPANWLRKGCADGRFGWGAVDYGGPSLRPGGVQRRRVGEVEHALEGHIDPGGRGAW